MSKEIVIEIRGPQGSGKSTLAALIGRHLDHVMVSNVNEDTGGVPSGYEGRALRGARVTIRTVQTPEPKPTAPRPTFTITRGGP